MEDAKELLAAGEARIYTPKGYGLQDIMGDLVEIAVGYKRVVGRIWPWLPRGIAGAETRQHRRR